MIRALLVGLVWACAMGCDRERAVAMAVPAEQRAAPAPKQPNARVHIDRARLQAFGLSEADVVTTLRAAGHHVVTTADAGLNETRIAIVMKQEDIQKLGDLVLQTVSGVPIRLADVADVAALPER